MVKEYSHIKKAERIEISLLRQKGYGIRDVAKALDRSSSSISDELSNNAVNGWYDPIKANQKAYVRRKYSKYQGMKIEEDNELREYVESRLKRSWSPEQIAGRLKYIDRTIKYAGTKAVYKYISSPYGRNLEQYLRYKGRKRSRTKQTNKEKLKERTFIDQRPELINRRERYGDWEGDFIVSGKSGRGVLLVLTERKARHILMKKITKPKLTKVAQALMEITDNLKKIHSLTIDNDLLFRKHKEFAKLLRILVYFCLPYCSWQKGTVENANKLIREYIPKGSDISKYSDRSVRKAQDKLNNRPKKCLEYQTPLEVMIKNNQFKKELKVDIIRINKKEPSVRLEGAM